MAISVANEAEQSIVSSHSSIGTTFGDIQSAYLDIMETTWATPTSEEYFKGLSEQLNKAIENLNNNDKAIVEAIDSTVAELALQGTTAALGLTTTDMDLTKIGWTADADNPKVSNDLAKITQESLETNIETIKNSVNDILDSTDNAVNAIIEVDAGKGQELASTVKNFKDKVQEAEDTLTSVLTNYNEEAADSAMKADSAYEAVMSHTQNAIGSN